MNKYYIYDYSILKNIEIIDALDTIVVVKHYPLQRFSSFKGSNHYISEAVGLIAPVWHYVGVKVSSKTHIKKVLNEES